MGTGNGAPMVRFRAEAANLSLRATVLVNSAARRVGPRFDGTKIIRYLADRDCVASLVMPESGEQATQEAQASAERHDDILFVVGGDGSVRDTALGLAGSGTSLAAVPAGTVNVWATETRIPRAPLAAIDAHLAGQSVHIDLGRAGDRCFLLMAGVGWDAEITGRVSRPLKRAIGDLAYIAQAAWMAPRLRTRDARWHTSEGSFEEPLAWMVFGNSRLYGGKVHLTPRAIIDDGLLDVLAACPRTPSDAFRLAGKLTQERLQDPRLIRFRDSEIRVETPGFGVQLDGDYAGQTPMTFSVDHRALLVSLPPGPLPPIFGAPHVNRRGT